MARRVRRRGACRFCDFESASWPVLRQFGRRGRRVTCCGACRGPEPLKRVP